MIILKDPSQMIKRVASMVAECGEKTASNSRSTTYVYKKEQVSICVTYFGDEITSMTINDQNDFTISDNGEVVCIKGRPKALLDMYEYEEALKDLDNNKKSG